MFCFTQCRVVIQLCAIVVISNLLTVDFIIISALILVIYCNNNNREKEVIVLQSMRHICGYFVFNESILIEEDTTWILNTYINLKGTNSGFTRTKALIRKSDKIEMN